MRSYIAIVSTTFPFRADFNDARYPGKVTVYYPLHPLFGRELPVYRRHGFGGTRQVEVQLVDRRLGVPVWMTDQDLCRRLTLGPEPRCSLWSVLELVRVLEAAGL